MIKRTLALILTLASALARAETLPETGVPDFAVAKLTVAQMGVFLDKNAAYANHLMTNVGPIAKIALANVIYKLPVDASLNFEGPAQIFLIAPITLGGNQDTASIFPVANAVALKANLVSVYGEPTEQNGAMLFTVPQPLPLPDKALFAKVINEKALLAPSADVLKQLESIATLPVTPTADAELLVSVPALRKIYGNQVEGAMQAGAYLASENIEGLKKVTGQLDAIITALWEIGTVELRLDFDKGSESLSAELAITPLKDTNLARSFATPPAALTGNNSNLLNAGAPANVAFRLNGPALFNVLKKYGGAPNATASIEQALLTLVSGENALALSPRNSSVLLSQHPDAAAPFAQKSEAMKQAAVAMWLASANAVDRKNVTYEPLTESTEWKGIKLITRKIAEKRLSDNQTIKIHSDDAATAEAEINGQNVLAAGENSEAKLRGLIDSRIPVAPELKAAFDAPKPGTLLMASVRVIALLGEAPLEMILPETISPAQIVGGLPDAPVSLVVFMTGGKAGLRATLPGATAKSLYIVNSRLRNANVNIMDLFGLTQKAPAEDKIPGNIPAPPPQK